MGVFQNGAPRTYIDDNGYFFTVIAFQLSSYAQGTHLNVALHFLWSGKEHLTYDFPFGPDVRIRNFVAYENDGQFTREVTEYVRDAARQVLFYRRLQEIAAAKSQIKKWLRKYRATPKIGDLNTIHRLCDEAILQKIRQTRGYWRGQPSMKQLKTHEVFDG